MTGQARDAAPVPKSDDWHLLRSCLMWGGVRELLGDDLHARALAALDRLAEASK